MTNSTYRERVEAFWRWYSANAGRLFDAIENKTFGDVQSEVSDQVAALWQPLAWVFGPGPEEKGGHSFTITGEGMKSRQFLTEFWLSLAPELDGWTFYSSRQPGEIHDGMEIRIGEDLFRMDGLWITPSVDEENQIVHVSAWHPVFSEVDREKADLALFLILDEVLGEHGTDQWLGRIETSDSKLKSAIPAAELRDFLHDLEVERGWIKYPPTETYSTYELKEIGDSHLRADTIAGSTCHMDLIGRYLDCQGPFEENDLEGSGAEFVFVSYRSDIAPKGEETAFRGGIEDALEAVLGDEKLGKPLGGAIGQQFSYIDLVLFDGQRSIDAVLRVLRERNLPEGTGIHFFEAGNESRRVVL
ncbi:MAG: hypothetical protein AAF591_19210 [Verrucomicrobiota bacterium]